MAAKKKIENAENTFVPQPSEKQRVAETLCRKGHDAYVEDGVVMARIKDKNEEKEIQEEFKALGYNASFGFILKKGAA